MSEKQDLINKIMKEGHSFPHGTTCKTCEEDFEEVQKFVAEEIFAELKKKKIDIMYLQQKGETWKDTAYRLFSEIDVFQNNIEMIEQKYAGER